MLFLLSTLLGCTPASMIVSTSPSNATITTHFAQGTEFFVEEWTELDDGFYPAVHHIHGTATELAGVDESDVVVTILEDGDPDNYTVHLSSPQTGSHGTWIAVRVEVTGYSDPCTIKGNIAIPVLGYNVPFGRYC